MKSYFCAVAILFSLSGTTAQAVTITGNTGPGGFALADGSSNLVGWFKADAITGVTDNTTFGTWVESSNTVGVSSSSGGNNPIYHANQGGLNPTSGYTAAVEFQGGRFLNLNGITALPVGTIVGVASAADDRYLLEHSSNRQIRMRQGGGQNIAAYNGGSNPLSSATSIAAGNYQIAEWVGNSTQISFYENGAARGTGVLTGGPGGLSDVGYNRIGRDSGPGSQMFVSEIAIFNTALNGAQRQIVENALSSKWNQALLANDRYLGDELGPGDYDRDVIGVGRVDVANQSTSAGAAGFGIEVMGGLDNDEWVFAGHRTPVNSLTSSGVLIDRERWDRAWYIDQTGNVDVMLTFDWSDAGLGAAQTGFIGLLRSTDGTNYSPISFDYQLDGDRVSFLVSGTDLIDGYYTLGYVPPIPEPSTMGLLICALLGMNVRGRRFRK